MKKIIYILILALASSVAITSCTEETVTPRQQTDGASGQASDPVKP